MLTSYYIPVEDDDMANSVDEFHDRIDKEGLAECTKCKLYFTEEYALKHKSLDHLIKCRSDNCDLTFYNKTDERVHVNFEHKDVLQPDDEITQCQICKQFLLKRSFVNHTKVYLEIT